MIMLRFAIQTGRLICSDVSQSFNDQCTGKISTTKIGKGGKNS